jgi:exopolysaccharide biosynthesis polyprenyl glycosylphosphotransferase
LPALTLQLVSHRIADSRHLRISVQYHHGVARCSGQFDPRTVFAVVGFVGGAERPRADGADRHGVAQAGWRSLWLRKPFRSDREQWQAEYLRNLRISDTLVVCGALAVADWVRFGLLGHGRKMVWETVPGIDCAWVDGTLSLVWLGLLVLVDSRSRRILGHSAEEYRRIIEATMVFFGVIAFLAVVLELDLARGHLVIALPLGLLGLLVNRRIWRGVAVRKRAEGGYQTSLLVVGSNSAAPEVAAKFVSAREFGYYVVGLCTPQGAAGHPEPVRVGTVDIPVVGSDMAVVDTVKCTGADTVALSATEHLTPMAIRRLIWDLEALGVDLIVTAGLMDVAAERISSQPVAGMALLLVDKPQYDHANSWAKRAFDVCFAAMALIVVSPVLVMAAIAVKASSRGPVLYRAERCGVNGKTFGMLKFRTMVVGADSQQAGLIAASGRDGMYFKIKDDPRVTPVGRLLRKFSIDELPQFINVLKGDMSVVGPRPQERHQIVAHDDLMRRRMLVRPGISGLWQVSGRSDLAPEDATRLDLCYVENWSMAQDLVIIGRTVVVVVCGRGAY